MKRFSSSKLGKRDSTNLKYKARIVKRVHDNPFCTYRFIKNGNAIPHDKTLKKLIQELLKTSYFKSCFPWNRECFYIDKFENPDNYTLKTFYECKENMINYIEHNEFLKNTKAYKNLLERLKVPSLLHLAQSHYKTTPLSYDMGLDLDKDINEQILAKLFSIFLDKIRIYLREERYMKKGIKTLVPLNVSGRVGDVTKTIMKIGEFFMKLNFPYCWPILQEYTKNLANELDREHKMTVTHLNNSMEYLTTNTKLGLESKRTVRPSKERIQLFGAVLETDYSYVAKQHGMTTKNLKDMLRPMMDKWEKPDIASMLEIRAAERATDVLFVYDRDIEEFVWKHMMKNPINMEPQIPRRKFPKNYWR